MLNELPISAQTARPTSKTEGVHYTATPGISTVEGEQTRQTRGRLTLNPKPFILDPKPETLTPKLATTPERSLKVNQPTGRRTLFQQLDGRFSTANPQQAAHASNQRALDSNKRPASCVPSSVQGATKIPVAWGWHLPGVPTIITPERPHLSPPHPLATGVRRTLGTK